MSFLTDWLLPTGAQTSAEQQANYDRQVQQYKDALAQRQAAGTLTQAQQDEASTYLANANLESQDAGAAQGFAEGAAQGFQNVLDAPGKVVGFVGDSAGSLLGGVLKNIPWWIYLAVAAALFVWMGGLALLRGRLAKV